MRWTAMLLAGGEGTRARAIDPDTPKALLSVGGMPAVTLQARWLAIRASRPPVEIMILTGQHGDRVAAALPRWIDGTPVSIVPSGSDGTVAAVSCGLGFATTDRVLCLNSDTIIGCELGGLLAYWPMVRAMTLLCSEHPEAPNRGEVVIEHDRLVRMQPSPGAPPDHPTPLMANVGVYLFWNSPASVDRG